MPANYEPKLAAPGAGLPAIELFFAKRMFARLRKRGDRDIFDRNFATERATIQKLIKDCPIDQRGERVLIKRLRGLEDSSRNWSVWMTLDHLRITNNIFAMVIASLSKGKVPQRKASTAGVKPSPEVGADVEESYEKSCDTFLSAVASVSDLQTEAVYAHPWFGPLDASGWQALTSLHMAVHRRQIEKITEGLSK